MKLLLLLYLSIATFLQEDPYQKLADAAVELTTQQVSYDPSYYRIDYPGGDVPPDRGVCTDVLIRAYRKLGTDLQKELHEDMKAHFDSYPKNWGARSTDTNIDHRRVPNLMTFFTRKGSSLVMSQDPNDYNTGDIVCWDLGGGVTHIGIVVGRIVPGTNRPMIVHNIGKGQVMEDCLFDFKIIGHYRYMKE